MASRRNKEKIAEKVQEIKRMQSNWMKQRASDPNSEGIKKASNQSTHPTKKPDAKTKKQETLSWTVSGDVNTTKKKNLRTRSASPARRQNSTTTNTQQSRKTPQSSIRSNPSSSRSSNSSRGSKASTKPPIGKGSVSDRSVSRNNIASLSQVTRTESEPNLFVKEDYSSDGVEDEVLKKAWTDETNLPNERLMNNGDVEIDNQTSFRTSRHFQSGDNFKNKEIGSDHSDQRNGHSDQSETRSSRLLEADAFDRLADQIASRVKAEMRQERQDVRQSSGLPLKSVLDDEDDILSSHHCIKCKQKMVPPDYIPTVLIPCGHTFCEPCAEDRIKCPTCRTKVSSTAENSTLLQIILGSAPNKRNTTKQTENNLKHSSHKDYHPTNYKSTNDHSVTETYEQTRTTENHFKQNPQADRAMDRVVNQVTDRVTEKVTKSAPRKRVVDAKVRAQNYISEFESLSIRCEAMREEERTVMEDVEETNREITQQMKTLSNISRQQDKIREEIQQLHDKISLLDDHKGEYERKCEDLEEDKGEKMNQLHMVRQMLRQLEGEQDKVRMLAQDLGVYLE